MKHIIGDKDIFAIEFEIFNFKPPAKGKSLIWIGNNSIGDYQMEDTFHYLLRSLYRIIFRNKDLWLEELKFLDCKNIYYKIVPFYNNPDDFYKLSYEEQGLFLKYDNFLFEWGDSFSDWNIRVIVNENVCKFLWAYTPLADDNEFEVRNNIKCFNVDLTIIKDVYDKVVPLMPIESLPKW